MPELLFPHAAQYGGPMLLHEPALAELVAYLNQVGLEPHIARAQASAGGGGRGAAGYRLAAGGVAVFDLEGPLSKYGSSLSRAPSMLELRQEVRRAAADPQVAGLLFRFDSPGGTYVGTADLAREIRAAAAVKPVHAYIEDMGASGAYWLASQADRLTANPGALVGSIGTYTTVIDSSEAAGRAGLAVKVIAAGRYKGAGTPGTPFTEEQAADAVRVVHEINEIFLQAVAGGRGLSVEQVRELATGQVHESSQALALGLIDGIGTLDEALAAVAAGPTSTPRRQETQVMSKPTRTTEPRGRARIQDEDRREEQAQDEDEQEMVEDEEHDEQVEGEEGAGEEDEEPKPATRARPRAAASGASGGAASGGAGRPATLAQLKTAIPDGDADFYVACLERGLSVRAAERQWTDTLRARLESRTEELDAVRKRPGVRALAASEGAGGKTRRASASASPVDQWNTRVKEMTSAGKTKAQAIRTLVVEEPELHQAYLEACNAR